MKKDIDAAFLAACEKRWEEDTLGHAVSNAIIQNGVQLALMNFEAIKKLPFSFSVDVWDGNVTDQVTSLRCWAFASLNNVRQHAIEKLEMKDRSFELSEDYIYFYDQLEKSNRFLNRSLKMIDEPLDSPKVIGSLRNPIMDNGQWTTCAFILDKYGIVPKFAMPDAQVSGDTRYVTRLLAAKLRLAVRNMRNARAEGADEDRLYEIKEKELADIYGMLCRLVGQPPKTFDFGYEKTDGSWVLMEGLTPKKFFDEVIGINNDDYMFVISHPSDKYAYNKTYVTRDELTPGHDVMLNLDVETIKKLVIEQLKGGEQVVMGCDVAKLSNKANGYMSRDLYLLDEMMGCEVASMSKKDNIAYKNIKGTHIMAFCGVNLNSEGKPDRWKVQNSYGEEMGKGGYYVMDDNWFGDFVVSVVINKKFAPEEIVKIYEGTPERMSDMALY